MTTLLRETSPTARKNHWCHLCNKTIHPGERYLRTTTAYDGTVGDFIKCAPCADDAITARVWDWFGRPEDGIHGDDAHEWATEMVIHGTPEDQKAAKNYLERANT